MRLNKQFNLVQPTRKYVNQFDVTLLKSGPGRFYLFNDILMLNSVEKRSETLLFTKPYNEFMYFASCDSIAFSFHIAQGKKVFGHSRTHYHAKFATPKDCKTFMESIEDMRTPPKDAESVFAWKNSYLSVPLNAAIWPEGSVVGDMAFFFGGEQEGEPGNVLTEVNLQTNEVKVSSLPVPARSGHTMSNIDGILYIFGGRKAGRYFNDLWKLENGVATMLEPSKPPEARAFHSADVTDSRIIVFGGLGRRENPLNDVLIFNTETMTWTVHDLPNAPSPRYGHSASICNDLFLIHGGRDQKSILADVHVLDLKIMRWRQIQVLGGKCSPRYGHRALSLDDCVLFIGGTSDDMNGLEPMALSTDNWHQRTYQNWGNYPPSLVNFGLCIASEQKLVIYGGSEAGSKTARQSLFFVTVPKNIQAGIESSRCRLTWTGSSEQLLGRPRGNSLNVAKCPSPVSPSKMRGSVRLEHINLASEQDMCESDSESPSRKRHRHHRKKPDVLPEGKLSAASIMNTSVSTENLHVQPERTTKVRIGPKPPLPLPPDKHRSESCDTPPAELEEMNQEQKVSEAKSADLILDQAGGSTEGQKVVPETNEEEIDWDKLAEEIGETAEKQAETEAAEPESIDLDQLLDELSDNGDEQDTSKEDRQKEEDNRKAEEARIAEEKKKAEEEARIAEEKRKAEEEARIAEEKRKAEEEARIAEQKKKAEEEARIAEEKRKAEEEARIAEEKRKAEEEARIAEEKRKAEEEARIAEEKRKAEEEARIAEEKRKAEEEARIAEEKRKAEEEARIAEEKRKAEEEARIAEEKRKAEEEARIAEEKRKAEEEARIAEEKRKAEEEARIAEEKRKAEEEARIAEEKRKAEEEARIAEEKRRAEEEARIAEEKKKAEEEARIAEEKKKAEEEARIAEEKKKAEEEARIAEEKRKAEEEARIAEEKKKAEEEARIAEEKKKAEEEARIMEQERKEKEARMVDEKRKADKVVKVAEEKVKTQDETQAKANKTTEKTAPASKQPSRISHIPKHKATTKVSFRSPPTGHTRTSTSIRTSQESKGNPAMATRNIQTSPFASPMTKSPSQTLPQEHAEEYLFVRKTRTVRAAPTLTDEEMELSKALGITIAGMSLFEQKLAIRRARKATNITEQ